MDGHDNDNDNGHDDVDFDNDENSIPEMDGHDGADAQEEPFDLPQRLAALSVNYLKVHILMKTMFGFPQDTHCLLWSL